MPTAAPTVRRLDALAQLELKLVLVELLKLG